MNSSNFKLIFILILIFISTLFIGQNTQEVTVNLLFQTYSTSVAIVVVSMLLIGILVGWFFKGNNNSNKKETIEKINTESTD